MVVNLFGAGHASSARSIDRLHEVYKGRVLMLPCTEAGNRVVLGFKGPSMLASPLSQPSIGDQMSARANWLDQRYRLGAARWRRAALPLPASAAVLS
jgi:hypothetical protein